jgi:YVTN family beta-propeller protein
MDILKKTTWCRNPRVTADLEPRRKQLIPIFSQSAHQRININGYSYAAVFDGTHVWISMWDLGRVQKIDIVTNELSSYIDGLINCRGLAFDGSHIWVSCRRENISNDGPNPTISLEGCVCKINIKNNVIVSRINVGDYPQDFAFDGTHMWVTDISSHSVSKIDIFRNVVVDTVGVGNNPRGIAFDGSNIWVANVGSDTVSKIDPNTDTVTRTVNVGRQPWKLAFDGTFIWVTNYADNTVGAITVFDEIMMSNYPGYQFCGTGDRPASVLFDGNCVNVLNRGSSDLSSYSKSVNYNIRTVPGGIGVEPLDMTFDGTHLWVTDTASNFVRKVSLLPVDLVESIPL